MGRRAYDLLPSQLGPKARGRGRDRRIPEALLLGSVIALACGIRTGPIEPGAIEGATYRNEALDLQVALPPGWAFLSPKRSMRRFATLT